MNENKFPAAGTIGYLAIFVSLFYSSLLWSGGIEAVPQDFISIQLCLSLLIAVIGFFTLFNQDKIDSIVFIIFGTVWLGFMLRIFWYPTLPANFQTSVLDGWFMLLLAVLFLLIWLAALKGNLFRQLFLLGLWVNYLIVAIGNIFCILALMKVFAYVGFVTAIMAGIYAASTIIDFKKS